MLVSLQLEYYRSSSLGYNRDPSSILELSSYSNRSFSRQG
nr:MAG TPA: hypothetical protein [Caudoviricetes sp.]DAU54214.1 MAG TPA: hypothetical protein [Bacteriophage sp.]